MYARDIPLLWTIVLSSRRLHRSTIFFQLINPGCPPGSPKRHCRYSRAVVSRHRGMWRQGATTPRVSERGMHDSQHHRRRFHTETTWPSHMNVAHPLHYVKRNDWAVISLPRNFRSGNVNCIWYVVRIFIKRHTQFVPQKVAN